MEPQNNEQRGSVFSIYFVLILLFLLFFILNFAYFFYNLQPVDFNDATLKEIKIEKGDGLKEISSKLSKNNLIRSVFVFKLYNFFTGSAHQLKAGFYEFSSNMTLSEIVKILKEGRTKKIKFLVIDGYTVKDIDYLLKIKKILINNSSIFDIKPQELSEKYEFLKNINSWEGFLFPDTYLFDLEMKSKDVLEIFLNNFNQKIWTKLKNQENWYDKLILASIIEKEVPIFSDRQIVAGILLKRLKINMPLQVDATITYIKCNGLVVNCKNPLVKKSDLMIDSFYNTYQNLGLPPTPISNPGEMAVKSVLEPKESEFWYYLSHPIEKTTIFSKTLKEHNNNILKYLK